jgi:predicted RNase H-like HicB family nuclease
MKSKKRATRRDVGGARSTRTYRVTVHREGDWYVAEAPTVPGAITQGRTEASARGRLARLVSELVSIYARHPPRGFRR